MKQGSEKYGTAVMKDEECLLFVEAALETNDTVSGAIADMRMIDTMLQATRLQLAVGAYVRRTRAGHLRKGSDLYTTFERIITGRSENKL